MKKTVRGRRTFTAEFKREAVRRMADRRAQGVSVQQIGRELELSGDTLRAWAHQLTRRDDGAAVTADASDPSDASELRRLQREVQRLQQENAFLKSAAAYFARESR